MLVNGSQSGAMGIRARSFAERLHGDFSIEIAYRDANKFLALFKFLLLLVRVRPKLAYIFDSGFSGVVACAIYRCISRYRVVVDTGDAIYELSRLTGSRGAIGLLLTRALEHLAFRISDRVVVRSHAHAQLLEQRRLPVEVIPDGVDTAQFAPHAVPDLRHRLELEGFTVIGLVGSLIWNKQQQMCYGWDLIEAIRILRDQPVKGLVIGDGSGLARLMADCTKWGIRDRVVFLGRIPYDDLPSYINLMDIAISTQTDDAAGRVRTSGKLPLYLACGRFVLASKVGEAARVLPSEMLIPYHATKDVEYPAKLAARVYSLLQMPHRLADPQVSTTIAKKQFDYDVLAAKLCRTLVQLLPTSKSGTAIFMR
jgi:glycosyltransferase involved in cell wall biosynthesis